MSRELKFTLVLTPLGAIKSGFNLIAGSPAIGVPPVEENASTFVLAPSNIRRFYHEVVAEFKKIVWPDRKVTFGLSGFVILLTVLLSIYLGAVPLGRLARKNFLVTFWFPPSRLWKW